MKRKLLSILLACILVFGIFGVTISVLASPGYTETLRPNALGDENTCTIGGTVPAATNWESVDEAVADDGITLVKSAGESDDLRDLYNLPASSGSGTINFIKVYIKCKKVSIGFAYAVIKSNGTVDVGESETLTTDWATYSEQWNTNPDDAAAWEWADIDALQIGVRLVGGATAGKYSECTQVYVEVDYTTAPAVTTNAATYVAKTTARLNSSVTDDGGEACDVRFGYGTTTQVNVAAYDIQTDWVVDTYTTGQHPFVDITALNANDEYFFRVAIRNNDSEVEGGELTLDTLADFDPPTNLKAYPSSTSVGLTWTKGVGATNTMIRYSEVDYPADETEGILAYTGILASYIITSLTSGHTYYIVAIGNEGANYTATLEVLATTTAGEAVEDDPDAPEMPTGWFQSPDYSNLSGLPLYDQMNDLFDAFELPRASGWFFSAILVCVILGAVVFVISRHPTPAVITLAVAMAIASLIKLLPLYMMAFSVVFIIGVWQLGRES